MKTIIYLLLAIFLFGIIATSFIQKTNLENHVVIQSVGQNISSGSLAQSAKIISDRLKNYSSGEFVVTVIPGKNQIKVSFSENEEINKIRQLITQKGELSFYESYNQKELQDLLNVDNYLFSFLKANDPDHENTMIGCTSGLGLNKTNSYINSLGLNQKCKFVWSQVSSDSEYCLYALKSTPEKNALMGSTDIESIRFNQDKASGFYDVEIGFKKPEIEKWANATKRNINRAIVIVLDNQVLCAPILRSEITNGACSITGRFTESDVRFFVAIAGNGELPAAFEVVQ